MPTCRDSLYHEESISPSSFVNSIPFGGKLEDGTITRFGKFIMGRLVISYPSPTGVGIRFDAFTIREEYKPRSAAAVASTQVSGLIYRACTVGVTAVYPVAKNEGMVFSFFYPLDVA